ncbi:hypothetical protein [Candidatus Laterigemmans baculatus]|uniref:hypothetical protein n=1 Tax=Candidatus Laterigemmans baculatus TaxID=2770505 RepID=UPI00193B1B48|nr:hypothetical protein [Candidatus Laterigemmans baculatus]
MMIRSLTLVACCITASLLSAAEPVAIGSRLELFVDDFLIAEQIGDVQQHLHQPTAREVVLVTDEPWEGNTSAYYTMFQDGDLYRMYYRGSHADEKTQRGTHPEVTCYAESRDGIHWTKPKLGLVEYEGSKANNIILKGLGSHCFVAFKDQNPEAPPEARYKGISRGPKGLYAFQSADGIRWSLIQDSPVITKGAFDSQNLAFWDPHTKKYVDYHRAFIGGVRAIMTCTSDDFVNWTDPVPLEYGDAPSQHLYTNAIRPYPRAPHIRVGFPTRFLPDQNARVEPIFMSSRDGVNFHRWNEAVIPPTAPKDRDGNRSNYMANALLSLPESDREYAVYGTEAYYAGPDSRLRRFTYRVDGFVSVRSGDAGGELRTKPLTFSGDTLALNFATHDGGTLRVHLETAAGEPIASSEPLTGDAIAHTVPWPQGTELGQHAGKPVRLRFEIKNADLYSLQFQPAH